jgi:hypothetical protein
VNLEAINLDQMINYQAEHYQVYPGNSIALENYIEKIESFVLVLRPSKINRASKLNKNIGPRGWMFKRENGKTK